MSGLDFFLLQILGQSGVILIVGVLFFIMAYKNSQRLFSWFEDQTLGTKEYVERKLELLQIKVKSDHITYALFGLFGLALFVWFVFMILGLKIPRPIMNFLVNSRIEKYQTQLVDGLNLLSNGVRAGLSLPQAVGMVVDEMPAPLSEEFNIILQQNKIGSPLESCLEDLVRRVPTEDNLMFVTAINILRETGGNLAEVFDTIVEVIRERIRLGQKIKTYTSQAKAQGVMIFCMPFALLIINVTTQPETATFFFTTAIGIIGLIVALFLTLLGGFMIMKILKVKV